MSNPTSHWRQLIEERVAEAVTRLGGARGVQGIVVAGSVARGEPWPMSDIDLVPIYSDDLDPAESAANLDERRAELVDWWTGSGRAQALDVGWLAFTAAEARAAMAETPEQTALRIAEARWFHALDKAYGGRAGVASDELSGAFAGWIASVRFHPAIVAARITTWRRQAVEALAEAHETRSTSALRVSARALRMVLLEQWGERLGSMGREWTRFERMAARHGEEQLAARVAVLAGADVPTAADRATIAPLWLRERIELCWAARVAVGEQVSPTENARDQVAAYTLHVVKKRPDLDGPWTGTPDPAFDAHLAELRDLLR